jgi:hypothetical protein
LTLFIILVDFIILAFYQFAIVVGSIRNKCDFCDNVACDGELELCGICQKGICPECQGPEFTEDEEVICERCSMFVRVEE